MITFHSFWKTLEVPGFIRLPRESASDQNGSPGGWEAISAPATDPQVPVGDSRRLGVSFIGLLIPGLDSSSFSLLGSHGDDGEIELLCTEGCRSRSSDSDVVFCELYQPNKGFKPN